MTDMNLADVQGLVMPIQAQVVEAQAAIRDLNSETLCLAERVDALEVRHPIEIFDLISDLRYEMDVTREKIDMAIQAMRQCARDNDLVMDDGGSLDEFLAQFQ